MKYYLALILFAVMLAGGCAGQQIVITKNQSIENITVGNHSITPVPPEMQVKSANLNESFKMKVGDEVEISGTGLTINVTTIETPAPDTFDFPSSVAVRASFQDNIKEVAISVGGKAYNEKQRQVSVFGFTIYATAIVPGEVTLKVYRSENSLISLLPPGGPMAATGLHAIVDCSQTDLRQGLAILNWSVATHPGTKQLVEITIYGFDGGAVDRSVPLQPDQSSLVWDQLHGQAIHQWRVLTLHPNGWVPSETANFVGPPCVADMVPPLS